MALIKINFHNEDSTIYSYMTHLNCRSISSFTPVFDGIVAKYHF